MGIFDSVIQKAVVKAISGKKGILPGSLLEELMRYDKPHYSSNNYENFVTNGWRKNELIFSCINKTAMTAAQVGMKVHKSDGELAPDHPLQKILQRPNPFMSEFQFWYAVITFLKLAGVAYFERVPSAAGSTAELWPMRPDWTEPVTSPTEYISGYTYKVPGRPPLYMPRDRVLRFSLFDPLNMFLTGWPPVQVAARVGDVDNAATDYLKMFWEKGGMPAGILTSKQALKDTDVEEIRKRWRERYGGYEKWLEPAVLDRDASFTRIGLTAEELGFGFIDERDETRICSVLDVPPIMVGARVGLDRATYSNYEQARKSWWEDSLKPQYELFDDVINDTLAKEFADGSYAAWDYGAVPAFQDDIDKKWTRLGTAVRDGNITINEFRRGVGLEEIDGGNVRMISLASQAVGEDQDLYNFTPEPVTPEPEEEPEEEGEVGKLNRILRTIGDRRPDLSGLKELLAAGSGLTIDPALIDELKRANENLRAAKQDNITNVFTNGEVKIPESVINVNVEPTPVTIEVNPTPVTIDGSAGVITIQ